jgi:hypothetical protein
MIHVEMTKLCGRHTTLDRKDGWNFALVCSKLIAPIYDAWFDRPQEQYSMLISDPRSPERQLMLKSDLLVKPLVILEIGIRRLRIKLDFRFLSWKRKPITSSRAWLMESIDSRSASAERDIDQPTDLSHYHFHHYLTSISAVARLATSRLLYQQVVHGLIEVGGNVSDMAGWNMRLAGIRWWYKAKESSR